MDALECMKTRRSVRVYTDSPVEREAIEGIVDAGRLAASANNIQPWRFVVVTEKDTLGQIAGFTDHGRFIANAPVCIAVFSEDVKYYLEDCCAATQNLLNAAHAYGLGSCWVAGDKKAYGSKVGELLGVPANYKLISLVAIGHPDEVRQSNKKPLKSVLYWERFGG